MLSELQSQPNLEGNAGGLLGPCVAGSTVKFTYNELCEVLMGGTMHAGADPEALQQVLGAWRAPSKW